MCSMLLSPFYRKGDKLGELKVTDLENGRAKIENEVGLAPKLCCPSLPHCFPVYQVTLWAESHLSTKFYSNRLVFLLSPGHVLLPCTLLLFLFSFSSQRALP